MAEAVLVLGRRFSLAPVLGAARFAFASEEERLGHEASRRPPTWARRGKETASTPEAYNEYLRRATRTAAPKAPSQPETIPLAPETSPPLPILAPPSPDAPPPAAKRQASPSTVYTRALGSESPAAKAKYAQAELTPEQKKAIDQWVVQHRKSGSNYVNPMAVALDVDAPVHRIAHHIESRHGISTVPGEKGPPAAGEKEMVLPEHFESWLQDHALRQAAADERFHGMPEGAKPVEDDPVPAKADDTEKQAQAAKLAQYARAGVISPKAASRGAGKLSLGVLGARFSLGPVLGVKRRFGFAEDEERKGMEKSPHVGFHGMIDPHGQLHPVDPGLMHEDWASLHNKKTAAPVGEDETDLGHLLKKGWVRVNNRYGKPQLNVRSLAHPAARDAVLEFLAAHPGDHPVGVDVQDDPGFRPRTAGEAVEHLFEGGQRYSNVVGDDVTTVCMKLLGWS